MFDYNSFTNAVIQANKELYEYINIHMTQSDLEEASSIGYGGDKSLNIDLIAEKIFIKYLSSFGDIISEEIGIVSNKSDIKIIIDPLDGSHNFLSGLPYYGTSVAIRKEDEYLAGYVCNLCTAKMIYRENKNIKTIDILNKKEFNPLEIKNPKISIFERAYAYTNISKILKENFIKYRSPGAAALSLASARNYKFVLFMGNLREFDIAATLHINRDLHIYKDKKILIMAKNYNDFVQIKEILNLF